MYYNDFLPGDFYPDGITPDMIDAWCVDAFGSVEPVPNSHGLWVADLLDQVESGQICYACDGASKHLRVGCQERRTVRQATRGLVRALSSRRVSADTDGAAA